MEGFSLADTHKELSAEWHPTKNGDLTPEQVTAQSNKKVWWYYPYDDPDTGKHFDFEWQTTIANRTKGSGCPFLTGHAVWPGFNDLATKYPNLAEEWHPTKNGDLTPEQVTAQSNKKVWWYYPYDDPDTGEHFDFEWETKVCSRTKDNSGCPFLTGHAVWPGFNDLATLYPELAKEWHPIKNGALTPDKIYGKAKKKVWWYLPYDDPDTGEHFDFEWQSSIAVRIEGNGCPYLSGHAVWPGFNDLATTNPDLAKEWHPTKNGNLSPRDVTAHASAKVWWFKEYDDPVTNEHYEFEWRERITNRSNGAGCPYLSGQSAWPGFNDLATKYPLLAKEWHPTKNGDLTPEQVTAQSNRKVWWYLPYDDPRTGKHFDFEWEARVFSRTRNNNGCPFLSGLLVWPGFNDLTTLYPEIAKEWHPIKNGDLPPDKIYGKAKKKVWWYLPYDDPRTGKHFDFEWEATVVNRASGTGCPYLSNQAVWPGFNDLATTNPDLAKEWHPTKNGDLSPRDVTATSGLYAWWYLPYDDPRTGKHFDFEWQSVISSRGGTRNPRGKGNGCPYLSNQAVWPGFNDLVTLFPEIAECWDSEKKQEDPSHIMPGTGRMFWWKCPHCGHSFTRRVSLLTLSGFTGCPECRENID